MSYAQRRRSRGSVPGGSAPDAMNGTRHDARASALPGLGALRFGHRAGAAASRRPRVENGKSSPTRVSTCWKAKKGVCRFIVVRQPAGIPAPYSHVEGARNSASERKSTCSWGAREGSSMCWAGRRERFACTRRALRQGNRPQDSAEMPVFDPSACLHEDGVKNLRLDVFQERIRREVLRTAA